MTSGVTDTPRSAGPSTAGELAWHTLSAGQVLHSEGVDARRGLSSAEAATRTQRFGPNKLAESRTEPRWHAFVRQYRDPMQIVLLAAGIGSLYPLKQLGTGILLTLLTLFNAVMGLMDNGFAALPGMVGEGRRVTANIERVANLHITKTVWATLLAVATGAALIPYPFLPRHLTIIDTLAIGVPAFFLALAPNRRRYLPGFVGRVLRFTVPAGLIIAASTFSADAEGLEPGRPRTENTRYDHHHPGHRATSHSRPPARRPTWFRPSSRISVAAHRRTPCN